jgi:hypothetical protein
MNGIRPLTLKWLLKMSTADSVSELSKNYMSRRLRFEITVIRDSEFVCKSKGKAVPLQAWSGPDDSRKLRFPDFMTTAQDGGKVVSLTHQPPLPPRNTPGTHFC